MSCFLSTIEGCSTKSQTPKLSPPSPLTRPSPTPQPPACAKNPCLNEGICRLPTAKDTGPYRDPSLKYVDGSFVDAESKPVARVCDCREEFRGESCAKKCGEEDLCYNVDGKCADNGGQCGRRFVAPLPMPTRPRVKRLRGGEDAERGAHPYQVWLKIGRMNGESTCGGTIIDAVTIITAAHCIDSASTVRVHAGRHNPIDYDDDYGYDYGSDSDYDGEYYEDYQDHRRAAEQHRRADDDVDNFCSEELFAADWKKHPNYTTEMVSYDIGIIKLRTRLPYTKYIQPACLPEKDFQYEGKSLFVTGWGETHHGSGTQYQLQIAAIKKIEDQRCESDHQTFDPQYEFCAGSFGQSPCLGDSGGPVVSVSADSMTGLTLVGVVAYGDSDSCHLDTPDQQVKTGVYVKVTQFLEWIERNRR